jgi:hypothetical protein
MGSKTTVNSSQQRNLTGDELQFNQRQLDLLERQITLLDESADFQRGAFEAIGPLIEQQSQLLSAELDDLNDPVSQEIRSRSRELELQQIEFAGETLPVQRELLESELERIRRGGAASDEQKALIGDVTERSIEAGTADIDRFLDDALGRIRNELAPARGLRPTDTPILDVADDAVAEAVRQRGQLTSGLRAAQASAELNFPLAASQLASAQTQFQQSFGLDTAAFASRLSESASSNRLRVSELLRANIGDVSGRGIDLASITRPSGFIESGNFTSSSTQRASPGIGAILTGAGAGLRGLGAVGIGF